MPTEVYYRRWRPQILADVIGQEPVILTLKHAIAENKVAHAYLFCGPRGTGKTSTGRILAKAVNCLNPADGEPCNTCEICKSITEGRSLDVIEIDAASNRGIDEVRSLREKVNYAPGRASYKVYIIDEVHMLTEAASNALLKTLEEPPPQVIFILATTEPHKVLPTIISRCQRFNFRRLSKSIIIRKLELICKEEKLNISPHSLSMIAHAAGGSLRDAENILQQLFSYYGDQLDWEKVSVTLGISNDPRIDELIHNILNRDISSGLKTITNVYDEGIDLHQFNQGLIQHLRELLMVINNCYEAVDVTEETLASMKDIAQHFTLEGLLNVIKAFSRLDLRQDSYSTLPFEVAFIESVLSQKKLNNPKVEERTKKTASKSKGTPTDSTSKMDNDVRKSTDISSNAEKVADVERTDKQSSRTADDNNGSISLVDDSEDTVQTENNIKPDAIDNNSKTAERSFDKDDIAQINNQWKDFIRSLRGEGSGGNLDAFLRSACELVGIDGDTLILGFYYPFHKEKIEDRKYRHLVEKKLKEVYNHPYKINCVLIEKGKHKEGISEPSQYSPLIKAALEMGAKIKDG